MEWLMLSYWLPAEPSRKRVFVWRQLKKIGALSMAGGGWVLPKTEPLSDRMAELMHTVEEMGGTTNLFIATHFSEAQEKRTLARFQQEREREYAEIIKECRKALRHIERESEQQQFNYEEVEELEGDLGKINRWFSEAKKRDFWEVTVRNELEKLISEVESSLADFTQKTYETVQSSQEEMDIP